MFLGNFCELERKNEMAIENKSYDEFCEILNKKINLGELITIEENLENLGMKDKTLEDFLEEEGIFQRMSKSEKLEKVGELKNFYSKRRGSGASEKSKLLESYRIILNDINKEKEYDNYLKKAKYVGVNQILKNSKEVYKRDGILRLNQIENYVSQINLKIKNESDARNIFYGFCRQEGIPYTVERDYKNTENKNKESQEDGEYRKIKNKEIKVAMVIAVLVVLGFSIYNYINTRDERYIDKGSKYLDLGKKEEAEKWFKKAVKENKYMSSLVASIYEVRGDDKAAEEWYLKSLENGDSEAMYDLGEFYNKKGDKEKSKIWYIKAIERQKSEEFEYLDAMIKLGDIYYKDGNKKDAKEMYENAAKKGNPDAMAKLGSIYYEEGDISKSKEWFDKFKDEENINMGMKYYIKGDKEKGKELLQKLAEKGNLDAKKILEKVE